MEMAEREAARPDSIDLVAIAPPPQLHFPVARAFLEHGIDVICEKPMTRDLAGGTGADADRRGTRPPVLPCPLLHRLSDGMVDQVPQHADGARRAPRAAHRVTAASSFPCSLGLPRRDVGLQAFAGALPLPHIPSTASTRPAPKSEKRYPCVRYEVSPMSRAAHTTLFANGKLRIAFPAISLAV